MQLLGLLSWNTSVAIAVGTVLLYISCKSKSVSRQSLKKRLENITYDVKKLPPIKTHGFSLKVAKSLIQFPLIGNLVAKFLYYDSGFDRILNLDLANTLPTFYPTPSNLIQEISSEEQQEEQEDIKQLLKELTCLYQLPEKDATQQGYHTVLHFHQKYVSKEWTPSQVALQLAAIAKKNEFNAIVQFHEEDLLQAAKESTLRFASNQFLSVWDGVPIAVKDEVDVKGFVTTRGQALPFVTHVATADCQVVSRLRNLGALIWAKTNMAEIGIIPRGLNDHHGKISNAILKDYDSGGSSSGSGVVVGANFVPVSIGADGGGSIRIPASFNGVYGLKPTAGLVQNSQETASVCYTVGVVGPLSCDPFSMTLAYCTLGRKHVESLRKDILPIISSPKIDLKGIKIGVYWKWFLDGEEEIVEACKKEVIQFYKEQYHAELVEIEIPLLEEGKLSHMISIASEMREAIHLDFVDPLIPFGCEPTITLSVANHMSSNLYIHAQRVRTVLIQYLKQCFESKCNVIALPTTSISPPKFSNAQDRTIPEADFAATGSLVTSSFLANFTGVPSITLPIGFTKIGLPIGLQIMSEWCNESVLLKFAFLNEQIHGKERNARIQPTLL